MNLKNNLQKLSAEHQDNENKKLPKENEEVLNHIKKVLESQARKGKESCSFKLIKLSSGPKYQIMSGDADAIEFSSPEYLKQELEKEEIKVSLKQEDKKLKHMILNCEWRKE